MSWFEPQDAEWTYVSRKLVPARLVILVLVFLPPLALASVVANVAAESVGAAIWLFPAGIAALMLTIGWVAVRLVFVHAWAEREDDLLVKRGRVWRRVTVIPYGRMQYVEVTHGPLARAFGIATVQLHTASPGTDARISGVPNSEAARLRDRLTERGEARLAGL